jgi:hypothetical protein
LCVSVFTNAVFDKSLFHLCPLLIVLRTSYQHDPLEADGKGIRLVTSLGVEGDWLGRQENLIAVSGRETLAQ